MGFNTSVYLIYGIKIKYDTDNWKDKLYPLLDIIDPTLKDCCLNDILSCLEDESDIGDYTCLIFDEREVLFIALYYLKHDVSYNPDDCLEVNLPTEHEITTFKIWCVDNKIEGDFKLYTKLCMV
jgi:hypothetical protein